MSFLTTGDFMQGITAGIIRAIGYQNYAAYFCIVCYWFIIFPLAYVFVFQFDMGIPGLWLSSPIGMTFLSAVFKPINY